ncbi:MAG: hypothetical protein B7Y41_12355 [Hydrogenophilales bacterium 28-61-23]|nr:MAG: hypothetical protein B7Y41_12355 [Hydrogenophilales bacterium 28-61-23]
MGYDSNLFRFASDAEAQAFAGESKIPSISYQSYGAGVDVDWKQGRQQVKARVSGNKTFYSKYSDLLDYAGREINGDWKWQLGNRWSGNLSASQNRTQSAYNDTTNGVIASNVRTDNRRTFQLDYWLHTDWRARAKLSNSISNYSAISQKVRDNSTTNATVGLYRLGQSVESVGVEVSKAEGTYDTHSVSDYSEQGVRLIGTWNFSGKTGFSGHMGYVQRERPSSVVRNFSGPEWNLRVTWTPTGKSQVEAALFRDLRSNDVVGSGHEVADGIKATVALLVAPKTRLITQASHDDIGYKGDSRSDKLTNLSISASYEAWRGGDISAGWQHSSRSSTDTTAEFDSNSLFVSANLRF